MRALSRELLRAAEEIDRIKAVPLTLVRPPALLFILFF
jgi:flagellar biosynthesis/type III secretory pathway M-ring protein FliF/YscJ